MAAPVPRAVQAVQEFHRLLLADQNMDIPAARVQLEEFSAALAQLDSRLGPSEITGQAWKIIQIDMKNLHQREMQLNAGPSWAKVAFVGVSILTAGLAVYFYPRRSLVAASAIAIPYAMWKCGFCARERGGMDELAHNSQPVRFFAEDLRQPAVVPEAPEHVDTRPPGWSLPQLAEFVRLPEPSLYPVVPRYRPHGAP